MGAALSQWQQYYPGVGSHVPFLRILLLIRSKAYKQCIFMHMTKKKQAKTTNLLLCAIYLSATGTDGPMGTSCFINHIGLLTPCGPGGGARGRRGGGGAHYISRGGKSYPSQALEQGYNGCRAVSMAATISRSQNLRCAMMLLSEGQPACVHANTRAFCGGSVSH